MIECSSPKENYLENFSSFISEVENNYETYTDENWEKKEQEYNKYTGEYYEKIKEKLTDEDQYLIGKFKGKYQTVKLKYEMGKIMDETSETFKQLEGVLEGISESISE
jgi:hypothetical protein